jgi:hypothetical protein
MDADKAVRIEYESVAGAQTVDLPGDAQEVD